MLRAMPLEPTCQVCMRGAEKILLRVVVVLPHRRSRSAICCAVCRDHPPQQHPGRIAHTRTHSGLKRLATCYETCRDLAPRARPGPAALPMNIRTCMTRNHLLWIWRKSGTVSSVASLDPHLRRPHPSELQREVVRLPPQPSAGCIPLLPHPYQ